jgi:exonuclease SbcC
MAKILRVTAKGYQSLYDVMVELSPGFNVVTGPSDSGKTAFGIRCIRWVALGEPSGDAFRYRVLADDEKTVIEEAPEVFVALETDEGKTVTKTRKKNGETFYTVTGCPDPFKTAEPPDEVLQALGIKKYAYGDFVTPLNFAFQLDAPFILSEPASVGAKILAKLAGIEVVDAAIKSVAKDTHASREAKRKADQDIADKEKDLLKYDDLAEVKEQLDACEYLIGEIDKAVARKESLRELTIRYAAAASALETCTAELDRLAAVPELVTQLADIETRNAYIGALTALGAAYVSCQAKYDEACTKLVTYENLPLAQALLEQLEDNASRLVKLQGIANAFKAQDDALQAAELTLQATKDLDIAQTILGALETSQGRVGRLKELLNTYTATQGEITRYSDALAYVDGIEEATQILASVDNTRERLKVLYDLQQLYGYKAQALANAESKLASAGKDYTQAQNEEKAAWAAAGGICPLCNQAIEGGCC